MSFIEVNMAYYFRNSTLENCITSHQKADFIQVVLFFVFACCFFILQLATDDARERAVDDIVPTRLLPLRP